MKSPFLIIFIQAYKLCSTEETGFDLSYECLISEGAKAALKERIATCPEFAKNLQRPETVEAEDGEEDGGEPGQDNPKDVVIYDETDSSKTIDEAVEALILQKPKNLLTDQADSESDHGDVHIMGEDMEKYTGHEFTSCTATN